jgi:hypothetical protein
MEYLNKLVGELAVQSPCVGGLVMPQFVLLALGGQSTTKVKELEHDFIRSITPYVHENLIRLDYLLTLALKV